MDLPKKSKKRKSTVVDISVNDETSPTIERANSAYNPGANDNVDIEPLLSSNRHLSQISSPMHYSDRSSLLVHNPPKVRGRYKQSTAKSFGARMKEFASSSSATVTAPSNQTKGLPPFVDMEIPSSSTCIRSSSAPPPHTLIWKYYPPFSQHVTVRINDSIGGVDINTGDLLNVLSMHRFGRKQNTADHKMEESTSTQSPDVQVRDATAGMLEHDGYAAYKTNIR